jgi:hypothetical protein
MNRIEELYYEAKTDKWFKRFAIFCRIALAVSFIPAGFIKIMGERFAAGLSSNSYLHEIGRATLKLSAAINVLPAKTLRLAKLSATAFISKVSRWIVVWQLLTR